MKVIQMVRSHIHYYLVWYRDLCAVLMVTVCVALACFYVYSVGQACLEETGYIRGCNVVKF